MTEKIRILVVEDEAIIAMDLQETLNEAGYIVIATLPSGEEALELCRNERPDIVLMDVHLQGTLNGIETAQQLRKNYAIPSVLLTAHYDRMTLAAAQQAGIFAYLVKPYEDRELCATLTTALTQARHEEDLRRQIAELSSGPLMESNGGGEILKICTFCAPLTMEFHGRIITGDLFTRTQREMLALLLSASLLRVDREVLETELWPDSPAKQARSSFDATLARLRKHFNSQSGSSAGMELFTLKNGVVAIDNARTDLHEFKVLDEEGSAQRRKGHEAGAITAWSKAVALWKGEFLTGISSHHQVLALRHYSTQRVFELSTWLAESFAKEGRHDEQIDALNTALRAAPTSEKTMGELYSLLLYLDREEKGKALLKEFARGLTHEGVERQQVPAILRRIEQRAMIERCARNSKLAL